MQLTVGEIVEGRITGITNFGVFVDLGEGKSGMVHISEVARTYVNEIRDHVKENDTVKMKILSIGDDGKISLSIKRAMEPERQPERRERRDRDNYSYRDNNRQPQKIDPTYTWTPKKVESASFEDMMGKFKQTSDEKFSDLKRKNPDARRTKRGSGAK